MTVLVPLLIHGDKSAPLQQVGGRAMRHEERPGSLRASSEASVGQTPAISEGE
ncbi:hypothetical protein ACIP79_27510 [Streptomyces sp. NPDC088747]|uniref:hypothetical protein n=1 Tax=Streptomyces sp. NPDC088747 TaxID=3365886 RepID=UPI00381FEFA0